MSAEEVFRLQSGIKTARDEIQNLRKSVEALKHVNRKDRDLILKLLSRNHQKRDEDEMKIDGRLNSSVKSEDISSKRSPQSSIGSPLPDDSLDCLRNLKPIGLMKSVFTDKNGTPRQPLVAESRGSLRIAKNVFNNPSHSLHGLEKYSHVWIIFAFHKNSDESNAICSSSSSPSSSSSRQTKFFTKAKVHPPRLGGAAVGVFACRSPHRPNPIGLTLAKIERIADEVVEFSGVDLIDGTPVLDLKPYIPDYDQPKSKRRKWVVETGGVVVKSGGVVVEGDGVVVESDGVVDDGGAIKDDKGYNGEAGYPSCAVLGKDKRLCGVTCGVTRDGEGDVGQGVIVAKSKISERFETDSDTSGLSDPDSPDAATPRMADWLQKANNEALKFNVIFTPIAQQGLEAAFQKLQVKYSDRSSNDNDVTANESAKSGELTNESANNSDFNFGDFKNKVDDILIPSSVFELKSLIENILREDPRSVYRRTKCHEMLYFSRVNGVHVTSWFDDDNNIVTVLKIS